jgi:hypothetical protein
MTGGDDQCDVGLLTNTLCKWEDDETVKHHSLKQFKMEREVSGRVTSSWWQRQQRYTEVSLSVCLLESPFNLVLRSQTGPKPRL